MSLKNLFFAASLMLSTATLANVENIKAPTNTCSVTIKDKLYFYGEPDANSIRSIVKSSNCPPSVLRKMIVSLAQYEGSLQASYLEKAFAREFAPYRPTISPRLIRVSSLQTYLKNALGLPENRKFGKIEIPGRGGCVGLSADSTLSYECNNCDGPGKKALKLVVADILSGGRGVVWAQAQILERQEVLVSKKALNVDGRPLDQNAFRKASIWTDSPRPAVHDGIEFQFHKLSRHLSAGSPLTPSHLVPLQLVTPGKPAKVIFDQGGISLSGMARPMGSGKVGDVVRLQSLSNGKIIIGRVVGFNTVKIDL